MPEISRLARSLLQIIEVIEFCRKADIAVYAIKGNWALDDSINSKVLEHCHGVDVVATGENPAHPHEHNDYDLNVLTEGKSQIHNASGEK